MKTVYGFFLVCFVVSLASQPAAGQAASAAENGPRVSITSQGPASSRSNAPAVATKDAYDALERDGERDGKVSALEQRQSTVLQAAALNTEFWFYDALVTLFSDVDRDGYFTGIELVFDADTIYTTADVYAVVYLSYDYGPWNEYAATDDFTIYGTSSSDEYVIETELVSGYPTGTYDILIELYDTYDGALVASYGPEDSPELSLLPLEDTTYDAPAGTTTRVVVNTGGGGSASWALLLSLALFAGLRRAGGRTGMRDFLLTSVGNGHADDTGGDAPAAAVSEVLQATGARGLLEALRHG